MSRVALSIKPGPLSRTYANSDKGPLTSGVKSLKPTTQPRKYLCNAEPGLVFLELLDTAC